MARRASRKSTTDAQKDDIKGSDAKPVLLSGGDPQIAKAAALPGWPGFDTLR